MGHKAGVEEETLAHAQEAEMTTPTRPSRRIRLLRWTLASILGVTTVVALLTFTDTPPGLHPRIYWLLWSSQYKRTVLSSALTSTGLQHAEWDGDGWGGTPGGDWTGYVVYDPSDSLPITDANKPPQRIRGIPCDVVAVRRLERCWYSVVTDMNQYWDLLHPHC